MSQLNKVQKDTTTKNDKKITIFSVAFNRTMTKVNTNTNS